MMAMLVFGVLLFSSLSASMMYDPDCVRGPPGPPGLPGSLGSTPPCRYIGRSGECYTRQGVFDKETCKTRFGTAQYEEWERQQQAVDYMESHRRYFNQMRRP